MNASRAHLTPLLIFVLAVMLTMGSWLIAPPDFAQSPDYNTFYAPVARNLIAGKGYLREDGTFPARYPPGYPLILAGVFGVGNWLKLSEQAAVGALNVLCSGLSAVLLYAAARAFWDRAHAVIVAVLWATYPFNLYLAQFPASELPFTVVFFGSAALFSHTIVRHRRAAVLYLASGLLLGVMALIRPIAIGLGLCAALIPVFGLRPARIGLRAAALMLIGNVLILIPWQIALYAHTGVFHLLSEGGVMSIRDGLMFGVQDGPRAYIPLPANVERLQRDLLAHYGDIKTLPQVAGVLFAEFQKDPMAVVQLFAIKSLRSWYGTDSGRYDSISALIQLPYLLAALWSSRAAHKQGKSGLAGGVWLVVVYFWLATIAVLSILRYMVPVIGLLFLLFPAGWMHVRHLWSARKRGRTP